MRYYRRNADVDLRELERQAAQGDEQAENALARERIRRGSDLSTEVSMTVIRRGPICGWETIWDYPGVLVLTPPGDWYHSIWITATPYWDVHTGVPVQVFSEGGGREFSLPDWELPTEEGVVEQAKAYRQHATSMFANLAALVLARASGVCSCSTFLEGTCPTHGDLRDLLEP